MSKMSKVLLFMLTVNSPLIAQNTWQGLRFGMSEQEVRKTYKGTLLKDEGEQADYLNDDNQKLEEMPAVVQLRLDKNSKTLNRISLMVTDPFAARTANGARSASLAAINMLNHDLAEKYGRPVTEKGECDLTTEMVLHLPNSFSCEKMWKSDGQSVRMIWYWSLSRRLVSVILTYSSLPKDL